MAYNTGNPIGSKDPRDLQDNAENFDKAVNADGQDSWTDRLGRPRKTWDAIEREAAELTQVATEQADRAEQEADRAEQEADRAEAAAGASEAAAIASALALAAYDTIDDGRAAVLDGQTFWVKPNETDGLTRYTNFLRTSASTQEFVADIIVGAEFDAVVESDSSDLFLLGFRDKDEKLFAYFRADGGLRISGLRTSVQEAIADLNGIIGKLQTGNLTETQDVVGQQALLLRSDGRLYGADFRVAGPDGFSLKRKAVEINERFAALERRVTILEVAPDRGDRVLRDTVLFDPRTTDIYNYAFGPGITRLSETEFLVTAEWRSGDDYSLITTIVRKLTIDLETYEIDAGPIIEMEHWEPDPEDPESGLHFSYLNSSSLLVETGPHAGRIYQYANGMRNDRKLWGAVSRYSDDGGETWSEIIDLADQFNMDTQDVGKWWAVAFGPGHGIQIRNGDYAGRLILPMYMRGERDGVDAEPQGAKFRSFIAYSDDGGETYQIGGMASIATNECQVAELPDGSLLMVIRNPSTNAKQFAVSTDGGETMSTPTSHPDLIVGEVMTGLVQAASPYSNARSRLLLTAPFAPDTSRNNMHIWASYDGGATWPQKLQINEGLAAYSDVCAIDDSTALVLYTSGSPDVAGQNRLIRAAIVRLNYMGA